ncbi:MAG: single-stranded DNA-binding protein, partial [Myxococcales bacterium]|nr:single-stranded DNA-binding protein [Myxococcales bacterium]
MAEGLNRVTLIGNLGQDPELRYTQGGQPILNMRLATTESFVNRDRERQERTEWHTVVLWGKRGEALSRFLSKGSKICVEGRLQTRSWEGKDGGKRYATEVVATNVLLLGGRGGGGGGHDDGPPPPSDDD